MNRLTGGATTLIVKSTNGDITIKTSISKNNTINLISKVGKIIDDNTSGNDLITTNLILSAKTGIGSGNALETKVSNLRATNTTPGNIEISNSDDLSASSVTNNGGDVYLTVASDLIVGSTSGSNVYLNATTGSILDDSDEANYISGGTVSLTANNDIGSATNDIDTDADTIIATATTGNIYLEEKDGAEFNPITTGGTGNILANGSSPLGTVTAEDDSLSVQPAETLLFSAGQ